MADRESKSIKFSIGQEVLFGRPKGERTRGRIVGSTRTGKLKIQQIGERGRGGKHSEGTVWTVPASLVVPLPESSEPETAGSGSLPCFSVPVSYSGWAWSLDARELLSSPEGWREILSIGLNAATRLYNNNPRPVIVLGAWDQLREGRYVLWFLMSTSGLVADDLDELGLLFQLSSYSWALEGQQPLPVGTARPLGVVHEGKKYVLLEREEGEAPGEEELVEYCHTWDGRPETFGFPFDGAPDALPELPRAEIEFVTGSAEELLPTVTPQHLQAAAVYYAVWVLREAGARSPRVLEWLQEQLPPTRLQWWGLMEDLRPTPLLELLIDRMQAAPARWLDPDERRDIANAIVGVALLEHPPAPKVAAAARALVEHFQIDPSIYDEVLRG